MSFEFVLIVYLTMSTPKYVGNFVDCTVANEYVKKHYPKAEYSSCLYENYVYLPKDFVRININE
jgi:hypothetical protein